ncbi:DEAD/DEAH box helicase family protein [Frankia sp. CNm7]|uniref:DEAD/DEAH box helicase family protein n=1 Tax=Frankia nepalensis TaxID=1836974 RepID=A0A937UPT0_9ACTN|nr:DEAD/DEAH box helicase family protein [Frankia nepalensis]MBL7495659.1 DEAD/DEAH box helicase family protein [Frankia nepalensis]MBL7510275.1 DEAD/DEAH box helicase family protein [Frankia nepalensis]MBL7520469.1 DEAD/DEAH box helicase family protein [Frankia nepalensis]MBL7631184.1 DEAD/DEAH box helicase family protein [Frankia nepalensis]
MGNFAFLQVEWPELFKEAGQAERNALVDPRASCFYARRTLELAVRWLYDVDTSLRQPYRSELAALIAEPTMVKLVGQTRRVKMDLIRKQGNVAVHHKTPVFEKDAVRSLAELFHVLYWIARTYTRDQANLPADGLTFDPNLIPRRVDVRQQTMAALKKQEEQFVAQQAAEAEKLAQEREHSAQLAAEIEELRAALAAAKAANEARPDTHDYDEAETRAHIIDLLLKEAGWPLGQERDREFPVTGMPITPANKSGAGKVDYVLWDDDGKPLGLVEAKRTSKDAITGQQQAKLYANCLEKATGQRPVIFYTNGYTTWLWDDHSAVGYPPREVQGFYTKDELRLLVLRRAMRGVLATETITEDIVNRSYQSRAIRRIGEAFTEKQRGALLVMATGSGKTRTVVALVDLLARANWVKRVLFLADRQALVRQATNAFKEHLPGMTAVNLLEEKDQPGQVYVSTYPTMMNMINDTGPDGRRRFGPGYFDLVVVDEAHRSIFQKYRAIFDYFDALLVGLTATPRGEIHRNTYEMFGLVNRVPTDAYDLKDAVEEGYLVPPRAVDVPLKFQRHGIRYDQLSDEEKEAWDDAEWSEDGSVPNEVSSEELNTFLFNADTVDKALEVLMTRGLRVAAGDRIGKTIIFAKNQDHAKFIAERFDKNYPEHQGEFARVITHQTAYAQSLIDSFSDPAKAPHIAISVDMLDTGIDVPEVVNLVFFKLIRSRIKFTQMIGRGTRLCPDLFGPGRDKSEFLVFDLCQNVDYFNQNMPVVEQALPPSLGQRIFQRRADLLLRLDEKLGTAAGAPAGSGNATEPVTDDAGLRADLARRMREQVAGMNPENFLVRPRREQVEAFSAPDRWKAITPAVHADLERLAGLPTAHKDDPAGEEAKRFDLLILRLQLACLGAEPGFTTMRARVREIATALLGQTTIPAVKDQEELLEELTTDTWWQDVTLPMLETVRRRLRGLIRLIEKSKRNVVYTDFEDELGELSEGGISWQPLGEDFEKKIRTYLRSHENQLAVQKLRRNRQITTADLGELEKVFLEAGLGTEEDISQAAAKHEGLGLFLRSLTGLDREAAARAFDRFQAGRTLTANQLHFLSMIVDVLARRGLLDVGHLYGSPFTRLAASGPEKLFTEPEIDTIAAVLNEVRATAVPHPQAM